MLVQKPRMREYLHNIVIFIVLVGFYIINKFYLVHAHVFFRWYFNDLLAMPLLLSYSFVLFRYYGRCMGRDFIVGMSVVCPMVWEYVYPMINSSSKGDIVDVVMYLTGSCLYYIMFITIKEY